jgi:hypothetical protein
MTVTTPAPPPISDELDALLRRLRMAVPDTARPPRTTTKAAALNGR